MFSLKKQKYSNSKCDVQYKFNIHGRKMKKMRRKPFHTSDF